jgi:hypothetical protein
MPVRRPPCLVAPALALLLAGCATAGDKFTANPVADAASTASVTAAAAAVRAFGHLCGRMEVDEVLRRARSYGFAPMDPHRLPPGAASEAARGAGLRLLARPGGGATALLLWTDAGPSCELALGSIDGTALTGEFDAMLSAYERRPEVVVNTLSPPADQTGPLRVHRAAVLAPRVLVPAPPRTVSLRIAPPGTPGIQAVMTMRVIDPAAPTPPPPGPGAPKD